MKSPGSNVRECCYRKSRLVSVYLRFDPVFASQASQQLFALFLLLRLASHLSTSVRHTIISGAFIGQRNGVQPSDHPYRSAVYVTPPIRGGDKGQLLNT